MSLWPLRYIGTLGAYSWRWQRRRMSSWLATAVVLGVVLSVAGAVQLVVWLGERSLAGQLQSASEMQVFVTDAATADQQAALQAKLTNVSGVSRVTFRSKAQAAARAARDPQLAPLAGASEGNPFPASFVLQMRDPGVAQRVLRAVSGDPAVDPKIPASYTAAQAQRLSSALGAMRIIAGALDVVALGVGAVVALALLRGEIPPRRWPPRPPPTSRRSSRCGRSRARWSSSTSRSSRRTSRSPPPSRRWRPTGRARTRCGRRSASTRAARTRPRARSSPRCSRRR